MNNGQRTKLSNYAAVEKIGGYGNKTPDMLGIRDTHNTTQMEFDKLFKLIKSLHRVKIHR
jgi:hypothetical protein